MSRIGRLPIPVPAGVDVTIDGQAVSVKGPKGTLTHVVAAPIEIGKGEDGTLLVTRPNDERQSKALHGLSRTLVANMITGYANKSHAIAQRRMRWPRGDRPSQPAASTTRRRTNRPATVTRTSPIASQRNHMPGLRSTRSRGWRRRRS